MGRRGRAEQGQRNESRTDEDEQQQWKGRREGKELASGGLDHRNGVFLRFFSSVEHLLRVAKQAAVPVSAAGPTHRRVVCTR